MQLNSDDEHVNWLRLWRDMFRVADLLRPIAIHRSQQLLLHMQQRQRQATGVASLPWQQRWISSPQLCSNPLEAHSYISSPDELLPEIVRDCFGKLQQGFSDIDKAHPLVQAVWNCLRPLLLDPDSPSLSIGSGSIQLESKEAKKFTFKLFPDASCKMKIAQMAQEQLKADGSGANEWHKLRLKIGDELPRLLSALCPASGVAFSILLSSNGSFSTSLTMEASLPLVKFVREFHAGAASWSNQPAMDCKEWSDHKRIKSCDYGHRDAAASGMMSDEFALARVFMESMGTGIQWQTSWQTADPAGIGQFLRMYQSIPNVTGPQGSLVHAVQPPLHVELAKTAEMQSAVRNELAHAAGAKMSVDRYKKTAALLQQICDIVSEVSLAEKNAWELLPQLEEQEQAALAMWTKVNDLVAAVQADLSQSTKSFVEKPLLESVYARLETIALYDAKLQESLCAQVEAVEQKIDGVADAVEFSRSDIQAALQRLQKHMSGAFDRLLDQVSELSKDSKLILARLESKSAADELAHALREADRLKRKAEFLSYALQFDYEIKKGGEKFMQGTRLRVTDAFEQWLNGPAAHAAAAAASSSSSSSSKQSQQNLKRVFWVQGDPGVGKSTLAAHLCQRYGPRVLAHHFALHQSERSNTETMVRSMAAQIAEALPTYLTEKVATDATKKTAAAATGGEDGGGGGGEKNNDGKISVSDLFKMLISQPLAANHWDLHPASAQRYFILIDALDELDKNVLSLLSVITELPPWLCVFVTSRREANLQAALKKYEPLTITCDNKEDAEDVKLFLAVKLYEHLPRTPATASSSSSSSGSSKNVELSSAEKLHAVESDASFGSKLLALNKVVHGHFLLARLLIEDSQSPPHLLSLEEIRTLPTDVISLYTRVLERAEQNIVSTQGAAAAGGEQRILTVTRVLMRIMRVLVTVMEPVTLTMLTDIFNDAEMWERIEEDTIDTSTDAADAVDELGLPVASPPLAAAASLKLPVLKPEHILNYLRVYLPSMVRCSDTADPLSKPALIHKSVADYFTNVEQESADSASVRMAAGKYFIRLTTMHGRMMQYCLRCLRKSEVSQLQASSSSAPEPLSCSRILHRADGSTATLPAVTALSRQLCEARAKVMLTPRSASEKCDWFDYSLRFAWRHSNGAHEFDPLPYARLHHALPKWQREATDVLSFTCTLFYIGSIDSLERWTYSPSYCPRFNDGRRCGTQMQTDVFASDHFVYGRMRCTKPECLATNSSWMDGLWMLSESDPMRDGDFTVLFAAGQNHRSPLVSPTLSFSGLRIPSEELPLKDMMYTPNPKGMNRDYLQCFRMSCERAGKGRSVFAQHRCECCGANINSLHKLPSTRVRLFLARRLVALQLLLDKYEGKSEKVPQKELWPVLNRALKEDEESDDSKAEGEDANAAALLKVQQQDAVFQTVRQAGLTERLRALADRVAAQPYGSMLLKEYGLQLLTMPIDQFAHFQPNLRRYYERRMSQLLLLPHVDTLMRIISVLISVVAGGPVGISMGMLSEALERIDWSDSSSSPSQLPVLSLSQLESILKTDLACFIQSPLEESEGAAWSEATMIQTFHINVKQSFTAPNLLLKERRAAFVDEARMHARWKNVCDTVLQQRLDSCSAHDSNNSAAPIASLPADLNRLRRCFSGLKESSQSSMLIYALNCGNFHAAAMHRVQLEAKSSISVPVEKKSRACPFLQPPAPHSTSSSSVAPAAAAKFRTTMFLLRTDAVKAVEGKEGAEKCTLCSSPLLLETFASTHGLYTRTRCWSSSNKGCPFVSDLSFPLEQRGFREYDAAASKSPVVLEFECQSHVAAPKRLSDNFSYLPSIVGCVMLQTGGGGAAAAETYVQYFCKDCGCAITGMELVDQRQKKQQAEAKQEE